jgi:hypothetical protein
MKMMNDYEKLDWISFAIQEAMNGNLDELYQALEFVEELRDE